MQQSECSENEILVQPLSEVSDGKIIGSLGVVKAKGIQIRDVSLTDYVIYGNCGLEKLSPRVRTLEYAMLPVKLNKPMTGLIFHGAVLLNAFYEARLRFGENVILLGNGYRKQLMRQIAGILGLGCFETADLRTSCEKIIDAVMICSKDIKNGEIKIALEALRPKSKVVSLAIWPIEKHWDVIFEKELKMVNVRLAGASLTNPNAAIAQQLPETYIRQNVKRNLTEFRDWYISGKVSFESIEQRELMIKNFG